MNVHIVYVCVHDIVQQKIFKSKYFDRRYFYARNSYAVFLLIDCELIDKYFVVCRMFCEAE